MIPKQAELMAAEHLGVLPIGVGTKYPPFDEWQKKATDDLAIIENWFSNGSQYGLGWKMGVQPDGRNLFAIDVDTPKGGKESFRALITEWDLKDVFQQTTTALTGGGGYHFVFELPPDPIVVPTNRSRLRPGIDLRAENGQIVVAPSLHIATGQAYAWAPGKAPWEMRPAVAGPGLMEMMALLLEPPPSAPVPLRVVPSLGRDEGSPADWVRDNLDFLSYLPKYGWAHLDGESWKRPGKTDRGSSAELKNNGRGPLNVFTTEIPNELARLGRPDASGQCLSFSLFDLIAGYEFGGVEAACASWIRRTYMESAGSGEWATPRTDWEAARGRGDAPVEPTVPAPPEWVWEANETMALLAQAARATGRSPAALWLTAWLQWMTAIPVHMLIPDFLGYTGTFDLIGCIAGRSGGGKTTLSGMARKLVDLSNPVDGSANPRLWIGAPDPTGEGLMEAFLMRQKGKKPERVFDGIHFVMDEGTVFITGSQREGSTIIGNLCKAWSGSLTGTTTASAERKRWFEPQSIRVTTLISMQVAHGWKMLDKTMSDTGLAQRMVFVHSADPNKPPVGERPARVETPILTMPRKLFVPTYCDAIINQVIEDDYNAEDLDPLDTHLNLNKLKIAWPWAALEGRGLVNESDWALATAFMDYSRRVRSLLLASKVQADRDLRHTNAVNRADAELVYEDAKITGRLTLRAQRLARHLKKHGDKGESDAINGTFGSKERGDVDEVVAWGLQIGVIERVGDRLRST